MSIARVATALERIAPVVVADHERRRREEDDELFERAYARTAERLGLVPAGDAPMPQGALVRPLLPSIVRHGVRVPAAYFEVVDGTAVVTCPCEHLVIVEQLGAEECDGCERVFFNTGERVYAGKRDET